MFLFTLKQLIGEEVMFQCVFVNDTVKVLRNTELSDHQMMKLSVIESQWSSLTSLNDTVIHLTLEVTAVPTMPCDIVYTGAA